MIERQNDDDYDQMKVKHKHEKNTFFLGSKSLLVYFGGKEGVKKHLGNKQQMYNVVVGGVHHHHHLMVGIFSTILNTEKCFSEIKIIDFCLATFFP